MKKKILVFILAMLMACLPATTVLADGAASADPETIAATENYEERGDRSSVEAGGVETAAAETDMTETPDVSEREDASASGETETDAEETAVSSDGESIAQVSEEAAAPTEEETASEITVRAEEEDGFRTETAADGREIQVYYLDGQRVTGQQKIDGRWYMFLPETGEMVTGFYEHTAQTASDGPKTCYYGPDGRMMYGQQKIDGYWYMFRPGTGAMVTGLYTHTAQTNSSGPKTCCYGTDGRMVYGQYKIGNYWYMFRPGTGAMVTGFYTHTAQTNSSGPKTCYYDANGRLVYGQRKIGSYWYMFRPGTGAMVTGFYTHTAQTASDGPKTCYYDANGHMVYGQQTINGKIYYFHRISGALLEHVVCIDAGHQTRSHTARIPEGPGADMSDYEQTNIGVTVGAYGYTTGKMEYQLNLEIALLLQQRLEDAGIGVVMIRTTNDVDITNMDRALIANESGADISIHIHADSVDDTSVRGAHCITISKDNPYCPEIYSESRELASCVLRNYIEATGFSMRYYKKGGINELDYYPMLNWSTIPTFIIEMGFMTNAEEDVLMSDPDFQQVMVTGIFNGIMEYYGIDY